LVEPDFIQFFFAVRGQSDPGPKSSGKRASRGERKRKLQAEKSLRNVLDRVYHALRDLGILPADRAENFHVSNAASIAKAFEAALKEKERVRRDSVTDMQF
jgi:PatG C-terminal